MAPDISWDIPTYRMCPSLPTHAVLPGQHCHACFWAEPARLCKGALADIGAQIRRILGVVCIAQL